MHLYALAILFLSSIVLGRHDERTNYSVDREREKPRVGQENNEEPTSFTDEEEGYIAYKTTDHCYLEKKENDETGDGEFWENMSKSGQRVLYASTSTLTSVEAWRLAGERIVAFCKDSAIRLLQETKPVPGATGDSSNNENPENERDVAQSRIAPLLARGKRQIMMENPQRMNTGFREKRQSTSHRPGRFRGQTQSQYLNTGREGSKEGKAEAEATDYSSRAVVSGSNGMGQAQSMSAGGSDCEGCPGYTEYGSAEGGPGKLTKRPGIGGPESVGGSGGIYRGSGYPGGGNGGVYGGVSFGAGVQPGTGIGRTYSGVQSGEGRYESGVRTGDDSTRPVTAQPSGPPYTGGVQPGTGAYPGIVQPGGETYRGGGVQPGGEPISPETVQPTGVTYTGGVYQPGSEAYPGVVQSGRGTYQGGAQPDGGTYPGIVQTGGETYQGGVQTGGGTYPGVARTGGAPDGGTTRAATGPPSSVAFPGVAQSGGGTYPGIVQSGGGTYPGIVQTGGQTYQGGAPSGGTTYTPTVQPSGVTHPGLVQLGEGTYQGGVLQSGEGGVSPGGGIYTGPQPGKGAYSGGVQTGGAFYPVGGQPIGGATRPVTSHPVGATYPGGGTYSGQVPPFTGVYAGGGQPVQPSNRGYSGGVYHEGAQPTGVAYSGGPQPGRDTTYTSVTYPAGGTTYHAGPQPGAGPTYSGRVQPGTTYTGGGATGTIPGSVIPGGGGTTTYPVVATSAYPGSTVQSGLVQGGGGGSYPGGGGVTSVYPGGVIPAGGGTTSAYPGGIIPGGGATSTYPGGVIPGGGGTASTYPGGVIPGGGGATSAYPGGVIPGGGYQEVRPNAHPGGTAQTGVIQPGGGYPGLGPTGTYPGVVIPEGGSGGIYRQRPGEADGRQSEYYVEPDAGMPPADDNGDSHASSSVTQGESGTQASASADGKFGTGTAQSLVSGTYSGGGSFSAQAGTSDGNKGAQTQVSGGKEGATSSAQGNGGLGKSQTQVQLNSETGATSTGAQTSGWNHGTNSQVQAGAKGGMADAQANGEGSTSSQAQIGFQPYDESNEKEDNPSSPFRGGGTASAQSGTFRGQSQSQLQGSFQYGITYNGAAQAGSGSGTAASRKPFNFTNTDTELFKSFKPYETPRIKNTNVQTNPESDLDKGSGTGGLTGSASSRKTVVAKQMPSRIVPTTLKPRREDSYDQAGDDDYEEDGYEDAEDYEDPPVLTRARNQESSSRQTQSMNLGKTGGKLDISVTQDSTKPREGDLLEAGSSLPGYSIPPGFRGRVTAVSGDYTSAQGTGNSQAQTVVLAPSNRENQSPAASTRSLRTGHQRNSQTDDNRRSMQHRYASRYTQPVPSVRTRSMPIPKQNYYTVTNSVAGKMDDPRRKYEHRYYTKSSTCGYFTFSCNIVHGSNGRTKICKPKVPTNPDGTPMKC